VTVSALFPVLLSIGGETVENIESGKVLCWLNLNLLFLLLLLLLLLIFICKLVDTRWQQYSTHLHTNSTQNTDKGIYITIKQFGNVGRALSLRVILWYLPYN
jgi:hypothetical protein